MVAKLKYHYHTQDIRCLLEDLHFILVYIVIGHVLRNVDECHKVSALEQG